MNESERWSGNANESERARGACEGNANESERWRGNANESERDGRVRGMRTRVRGVSTRGEYE